MSVSKAFSVPGPAGGRVSTDLNDRLVNEHSNACLRHLASRIPPFAWTFEFNYFKHLSYLIKL